MILRAGTIQFIRVLCHYIEVMADGCSNINEITQLRMEKHKSKNISNRQYGSKIHK